MGVKKGKTKAGKAIKAGKKLLGMKGGGKGRRRETVTGLQNKILKLKLKKRLMKLRYGGRI